MKDRTTPKKSPPLGLAEAEDRVAARMRELRHANPDLTWQDLLRLAFPK